MNVGAGGGHDHTQRQAGVHILQVHLGGVRSATQIHSNEWGTWTKVEEASAACLRTSERAWRERRCWCCGQTRSWWNQEQRPEEFANPTIYLNRKQTKKLQTDWEKAYLWWTGKNIYLQATYYITTFCNSLLKLNFVQAAWHNRILQFTQSYFDVISWQGLQFTRTTKNSNPL